MTVYRRCASGRLVVVLVFGQLVALVSFGHARQATQQPPVFRSTVDVVQLDVSVLDKDQRPVRGLVQGDFTVFEDGKPMPVVAFKAFDVDDEPPPAPVKWMRDIASDVTSNSLDESRLFVLVVDDACIPMDPRFVKDTKHIVETIIEKLGPNDLASIIFTGDNRKTQDFTNDKSKLLAAMEKFHPGLAAWKGAGASTDSLFFQYSIGVLSSVADYLVAVPNRRKALVYVSPGVPVDPMGSGVNGPISRDTQLAGNAAAAAMLDQAKIALARAQRANVAVYAVDPTGLGGLADYITGNPGMPPPASAQLALDFLKTTAENTGGRAIINTSDFDPGIDQIFRENSSYYLLGFQSTNPKVGGVRRLEVKVNRPGVEVHTRTQYEAAKPEKPSSKAPPTALAKAIGGILPVGELPMQVTLAAFAVPGKRMGAVSIALGVQQQVPAFAKASAGEPGSAKASAGEPGSAKVTAGEPAAAKASAGAPAAGRVTLTTELLTTAYTPEGGAKGSQRSTAKVVLRPGADGEASYEVLGRIDLAPGRYRLRLAAHDDTSDKSGSVFADVEIPDFQNVPFDVSGAVLSASPARPAAPKDILAGILPFAPTAQREFLASDRVTAFVQMYQKPRQTLGPVVVTTRIVDGHDIVRSTETQTLGPDRFLAAQTTPSMSTTTAIGRAGMMPPMRSEPAPSNAFAAADFRYTLPFDKLGPGPHLLTIEASLGTTTVRRDIRFVIQ